MPSAPFPPPGQPELHGVLRRYFHGEISPELTLMELLLRRVAPSVLRRTLDELPGSGAARGNGSIRERAEQLGRLFREHESGCAQIAAMLLGGAGETPRAPTELETIDSTRRLFDRAVGQSEEASVALYSLGSPRVLEMATREVVGVMRSFGLLGRDRSALEIGCGIGRMQLALASDVREAYGVDISPNMIEVARRRAAGHEGVRFFRCSGRDLSMFPPSRFDLVFAVDSFPYIHAAGPRLVEAHFREVARVLGPGGDFAIMSFSYRGDPDRDREEVRVLSTAFGFDVITAGTSPFSLWNGLAFHLRRAGGRGEGDRMSRAR